VVLHAEPQVCLVSPYLRGDVHLRRYVGYSQALDGARDDFLRRLPRSVPRIRQVYDSSRLQAHGLYASVDFRPLRLQVDDGLGVDVAGLDGIANARKGLVGDDLIETDHDEVVS
jgi:hypothetical protein